MRYVASLLVVAVCFCGASVPASASGVPDLRTTSHVYLIIGENTSIGQINKSNAPFLLHTLKPQGAWLTNYLR